MNRNSTEYQNLVSFWAHGDSNNEFNKQTFNRVQEILNDFPGESGLEIVEAIKQNLNFRDDYGLTYFDIHHREGFVASENHDFYADVMAEIRKSILEARR